MKAFALGLVLLSLPLFAAESDNVRTAVESRLTAEAEALAKANRDAEAALQTASMSVRVAEAAVEEPEAKFKQLDAQYDEIEAQLVEANNVAGSSENSERIRKLLKKAAEGLAQELKALQPKYDAAKKKHEAAKKAVENSLKAQENARLALKKTEKALEDFYNTRARTRTEITDTPAAATKASREVTATERNGLENLREEIRNLKVGGTLESVGNNIKNAELKRHLYADKERLLKMVMEQELNKAATGKFMQMKMEGLLTDPAFCEAAKECPKPKAKSLDKLFDSTAVERAKKPASSH